MDNHNQEAAKLITDGLSVVTVVGTLAGLLPAVAALFTIIWTGIRIYETETVQRWLGK
jgi:hypothetical protein